MTDESEPIETPAGLLEANVPPEAIKFEVGCTNDTLVSLSIRAGSLHGKFMFEPEEAMALAERLEAEASGID